MRLTWLAVSAIIVEAKSGASFIQVYLVMMGLYDFELEKCIITRQEGAFNSAPQLIRVYTSGGKKAPPSLFPLGHSAVEELEPDAMQQLASHASDAR